MRYFPLKKEVLINNSANNFLDNYTQKTEIPLLPHPGAFGYVRKNHQHEGVDLYAQEGDEVIAIECGVVIDIFPFTGAQVQTPWWNDTWAVLIASDVGVINYGEIVPEKSLKVGGVINAGQVLGYIKTVLTKNKGRPMSMLHLELYASGTKEAIKSWDLGTPQPKELLDPTLWLIDLAKNNLVKKDNK